MMIYIEKPLFQMPTSWRTTILFWGIFGGLLSMTVSMTPQSGKIVTTRWDRTLESWKKKEESSPFMAQEFRWVKYDAFLPRYISLYHLKMVYWGLSNHQELAIWL